MHAKRRALMGHFVLCDRTHCFTTQMAPYLNVRHLPQFVLKFFATLLEDRIMQMPRYRLKHNHRNLLRRVRQPFQHDLAGSSANYIT